MYRAIYRAATNDNIGRSTFCFIVQENYAPYQTGLRVLSQQLTQEGQMASERLLAKYCKCLKTSKWAGYDVGPNTTADGLWSVIEMEPWMEFNALSESMEDNQAELLGDAVPEDSNDVIP
jgi:hypothetical protein